MGKTQENLTLPTRNTKKKLKLPKLMKINSKATNMCKAIVLGPIATILAISIVYIAWWGLSKLFYLLHSWMTTSVAGWAQGAWPYVLGIWAFVLITSIAFAMLSEKKKITEKTVTENNSNVSNVIVVKEEEIVHSSNDGEDIFSDSSKE